ncbi:Uncharacterised protein [Klebsiella aerogenes]|nr:Uncharacterised protein [Klebsiella aerogenes]
MMKYVFIAGGGGDTRRMYQHAKLAASGYHCGDEPTESGIVASSAKYSYRFVRDGVPQEYQRYKTFYERFHQQASGVRVNFVVVQHEVTAEYLVVMDQRKLDAGQHSELVNQYHAVQIDNDRLGVLFKATGFWTASDASDLAAAYQLAHPVVVSINDKTKND